MVQPLGSSTSSYATGGSPSAAAPVIHKAELDSAASALGVAYSDLVSALASGKSIAYLASAKNVSLSNVETAILAPAKSTLDGELKNGTITQAVHDQLLQSAQAQVAKVVQWSAGSSAAGTAASTAAMEQADALATLIGTTSTNSGEATLFQSLLGSVPGLTGVGGGAGSATDPLLTPALQQATQSLLGYSSSGQPAGTPSSLASLLQQLNTQA